MLQIPNLASFRKEGRGRGRGAALGPPGRKSRDEIIRATDYDAASSRLSAVEAGYLDDPFAAKLVDGDVQRRLPLMNRGTFARTTGIDRIVDTFISAYPGDKQIVSLGAGSDTRYFRLRRRKRHLKLVYHEVDFAENNVSKIRHLQDAACRQMIESLCDFVLPETESGSDELQSADYSIHAVDLRQLPDTLPWLNTEVPTLIVSECCLIYLSPSEADNVLQTFSRWFTRSQLAVVIYEPIRPNDAFGKTMIRNLVSRGIYLQTLEKYADLEKQESRFTELGLSGRALDIDTIWRRWIDEAEKERIDKLEWMDEVEEFVLLAKHYCISWGWRDGPDDSPWRALTAS